MVPPMPVVAIVEDLALNAERYATHVRKHLPGSKVQILSSLDQLCRDDTCRLPELIEREAPHFADACMLCDICMVHSDCRDRQGLHYLRRLHQTPALKAMIPRVVVYSALLSLEEKKQLVNECGIPADNIVMKQSDTKALNTALQRIWQGQWV
jgi:CheY-like chemotaxis protein